MGEVVRSSPKGRRQGRQRCRIAFSSPVGDAARTRGNAFGMATLRDAARSLLLVESVWGFPKWINCRHGALKRGRGAGGRGKNSSPLLPAPCSIASFPVPSPYTSWVALPLNLSCDGLGFCPMLRGT